MTQQDFYIYVSTWLAFSSIIILLTYTPQHPLKSKSSEPTICTNYQATPHNPLLKMSKRTVIPILQFPREIRDMIYSYTIADGTLEILRTNKRVHEEASPLVSKSGVLRVNLGFRNALQWSQLGTASVASIKHLELRLNLTKGAPRCRFELLSGFFDRQIKRGSCLVILDFGDLEGQLQYMEKEYHSFDPLARLAGFQSIDFQVPTKFMVGQDRWVAMMATESYFKEILPYKFRLYQRYY